MDCYSTDELVSTHCITPDKNTEADKLTYQLQYSFMSY